MGQSVIMLIVFGVLLLVVGVYYLYDKSKGSKTNKGQNQKGTTDKDLSVQGVKRPEKQIEQKDMSGFIKFDKIANDMIYQNNGERYTMVIQCKGINYNLMSEIEQMAIEEGFIMFLNTLKFPIQLYVQTRSIDLGDSVKLYKERVKEFVDKQNEVTQKYNEVEDDVDSTQEEIDYMKKEKLKYTNIAEYVSDITRYVERMAMNKYMLQRNFYIVFSYNKSELITTEKFSKEEYEDMCYRELYTRAQGIIGSLMSCSVTSKILTSNELAQLLYVSFNKDDANTLNIKDALEAGVFKLYTSSEDVLKKKKEILDEELNRQSLQRVEDAVKEAIEKGLLVSEAESKEAVEKEIDRRALKVIDRSSVNAEVKQTLKNTIKDNRKKRLEKIKEDKEKMEAEAKAKEAEQEAETEVIENKEEKIESNIDVVENEVITNEVKEESADEVLFMDTADELIEKTEEGENTNE